MIEILPGLPAALVASVEGVPPKARPTASLPTSDQGAAIRPAAMAHPPTVAAGPVSLTATIWNDDEASLHGLFLPFEAGIGAAAYRRGDDVLLVFDAARPLDLSNVQDNPSGAGASVQLLPEATIIRLPGRGASGLVMRRFLSGWLIETHHAGDAGNPIAPIMDGAAVRLPVEEPGRVVVVPDPQTGGNVLVGTVRGGHASVRVGRRGIAAIIEPSIQGVVIDPLSDRLELRPTRNAFILSGAGAGALDVADIGSGTNARITAAVPRVMALRDRPQNVLQRQFEAAQAAAAAAPAESRLVPRMLAAEDALALGDALQAEIIARVAIADDARDATGLRPRLVLAAAQLLAHHPQSDDLLDDPAVLADGDGALWRAVKLAEQDPASPEAARLFAAGLPLLRSYPGPLRAALMPIAQETLVRGGTDAQATMIEHLNSGEEYDFARALLEARRKKLQSALVILDRLASSREIPLADKAAEEAVAIRQATGTVDLGKQAAILESHILDARIGGHELPSRLRLADLWTKAGRWRKALDLIRETATLFPDQQTDLHRRAGAVLTELADAMAKSDDGDALDQVAMIEGNADMLPDGPDGRRVCLLLADRLSALDLPERAAPVIQKMMQAADPGADKAELGLQLATLELQLNDFPGVQEALGESEASGLSADLVDQRLLVAARALAAAGRPDQSFFGLAAVNTAPALEFKAALLEQRGDWKSATDMLLALARKQDGVARILDRSGQDLLLRLASAASRSRDKVRIAGVRDLGHGRFADPGKGALFHLLTSGPGVDDADRAGAASDIAALRHVPAVVDAISD